MHHTHVIGVDPGLVHTGVVRLLFTPESQAITVEHEAVAGPDTAATGRWIRDLQVGGPGFNPKPHIFVEGYRPRSHFSTDERMTEAVQNMRRELDATVLLNTGVKKVVKQPLMELLGVWKFSTSTHHQDLRSAARIALLGMLKNELLNRLLTDVVRAHLAGRPWRVHL